ncbi:hypothetical protein, partial [Pseudomonas savastanoi]|uniref:hypothetical protein n=1 Tax=Pseudomonas savastanoi TaxID=29438 RepID=UPI0006B9E0DA
MILIEAHGVGFITTEQVDTRHDDVDMWLAFDRLAGLLVSYIFNLGQMRLSVKIEFFRFIRIHEKLFEFGCNCFKCGFSHSVFTKTKCERQIPVLAAIRNTLINR